MFIKKCNELLNTIEQLRLQKTERSPKRQRTDISNEKSVDIRISIGPFISYIQVNAMCLDEIKLSKRVSLLEEVILKWNEAPELQPHVDSVRHVKDKLSSMSSKIFNFKKIYSNREEPINSLMEFPEVRRQLFEETLKLWESGKQFSFEKDRDEWSKEKTVALLEYSLFLGYESGVEFAIQRLTKMKSSYGVWINLNLKKEEFDWLNPHLFDLISSNPKAKALFQTHLASLFSQLTPENYEELKPFFYTPGSGLNLAYNLIGDQFAIRYAVATCNLEDFVKDGELARFVELANSLNAYLNIRIEYDDDLDEDDLEYTRAVIPRIRTQYPNISLELYLDDNYGQTGEHLQSLSSYLWHFKKVSVTGWTAYDFLRALHHPQNVVSELTSLQLIVPLEWGRNKSHSYLKCVSSPYNRKETPSNLSEGQTESAEVLFRRLWRHTNLQDLTLEQMADDNEEDVIQSNMLLRCDRLTPLTSVEKASIKLLPALVEKDIVILLPNVKELYVGYKSYVGDIKSLFSLSKLQKLKLRYSKLGVNLESYYSLFKALEAADEESRKSPQREICITVQDVNFSHLIELKQIFEEMPVTDERRREDIQLDLQNDPFPNYGEISSLILMCGSERVNLKLYGHPSVEGLYILCSTPGLASLVIDVRAAFETCGSMKNVLDLFNTVKYYQTHFPDFQISLLGYELFHNLTGQVKIPHKREKESCHYIFRGNGTSGLSDKSSLNTGGIA